MHLCERQSNLTRRACCQLVLLLNDTTKVPLCNVEFLTQNYSDSSFYSPPIFLDEPSEVREDHVTFLLGIMVLMLVACGCIFTLSRLTKPRFRINYGSISNYDFMMWMPSKTNRREAAKLVKYSAALRSLSTIKAALSTLLIYLIRITRPPCYKAVNWWYPRITLPETLTTSSMLVMAKTPGSR
ncbi:hypothetical protein Y032_0158g3262 [Ancylostoma ceylanicum]|uniref:Uncharacterized protein n=1 Tax=Ancylostoma ceylanicum TaxID=53326 RepID=A0A016SY12_9BILA|nr:hypothetical protein Y032_0158g3262 [Ancylostoma ceylanicum]